MADDVIEGSRWGIDPRARRALAMSGAEKALAAGEPSLALALTEELLDEDPDDVEALKIVAEAATDCGLAPVGALAARQLLGRGEETYSLLAWALLSSCEPDDALAAADKALAADPKDTRAWMARALALDLLGDRVGSDAAWAELRTLDPQRAGKPLTLHEQEWDSLLLEALSGLAGRERARARDVVIRFAEVPRVADLRLAGSPHPPVPPTTNGVLLRTGDDSPTLRLYRRNILRHASTTAEVVQILKQVLETELAGPRDDGE